MNGSTMNQNCRRRRSRVASWEILVGGELNDVWSDTLHLYLGSAPVTLAATCTGMLEWLEMASTLL